jgi:hypothetical protein
VITWLSSYPRSGNTFVRILLNSGFAAGSCSVYNDTDISGNADLASITGHRALPERINDADFDLEAQRAGKQVVFVKTHEITPALVNPGDRVIYIVRDGREAVMSHARYERDIMQRDVSVRELIMGMHFPGGSWADHLRNWNPLGREDTLLLRFEELITDPDAALDRLSEFTGLPVRSRDIPEFVDLQQIDARFFSSGQKDSYRHSMPADAEALFWLHCHREMRAMAYLDNAPEWLARLDKALLEQITDALQRSATDLVARQAQMQQASQQQAEQQQAHIHYRDRLVRELRHDLDHQTRELELMRAQTFQIQDELAFYYRAFNTRDEQLEQFLLNDPQLRLARLVRKTS